MKGALTAGAFGLVLSFSVYTYANERWLGVDETVVEKFASDAGAVSWGPVLNTDQGDLILFMFLVFGAAAGFIAGYTFRHLFPPKEKREA